MSVRQPPLHERNLTLACGYTVNAPVMCGAPAAWHLSWYEHGVDYGLWENSLACEVHKIESVKRWDVGWRHRITHACGMSGSVLHLVLDVEDEDGIPVSSCRHPLDTATETIRASVEAAS